MHPGIIILIFLIMFLQIVAGGFLTWFGLRRLQGFLHISDSSTAIGATTSYKLISSILIVLGSLLILSGIFAIFRLIWGT